MTVGRKDFDAQQGATFRRVITWKDGSGALVDLTGWTAAFTVRASFGAAEALLDLTTENGGVTLGGAAGTIDVRATDEQMGALTVPNAGAFPPVLTAAYNLTLTAPGGDVTRLLEGRFVISRKV